MSYYSIGASEQTEVRQRSIISQAFLWMTLGLGVSGVVGVVVASSPTLITLIFGNPITFFAILIVEIILVIALSAAIMRLPTGVALTMFVVYAALNGLILSSLFTFYSGASLASTLFITGGTFAIMGIYGYTTKRDLTRIGSLALMALIGLILASLVNFFLQNPILYWITTYIGILIFVALTAYDTQRLKRLSASGEGAGRLAILGALRLYLDFVNLFLFFLRIFGRVRN